MKKILLIIAAFVIFLVTVLIYEKTSFDVIFTANVEALSQAEHGEYIKCWKNIRDDISDVVLYFVSHEEDFAYTCCMGVYPDIV